MQRVKKSWPNLILGIVAIFLALAWGKEVGVRPCVYLPPFPDYLDVTLGLFIGIWLIYLFIKEAR